MPYSLPADHAGFDTAGRSASSRCSSGARPEVTSSRAQDLDLAGESVAAFQSTLPIRGRSARSPVGRGRSGVDVAAGISENHIILIIIHIINSQTIR